ncbi:MAG: cysteine--tRNA ligase [Clostridiales bacterium]|nr:cysteine--tRNA ligase [Clostridiales bacterium]
MYIYNSQSRKKEEFKPIKPGEVSIYSCGPTVYDYFHIGNARPFIIFDVLRRYFEYRGYKVNFVQNFTDIDDKMIRRANEEGITVKELGDRFIAEYYKDAEALGIRPATVQPRATEHIEQIIAMVKRLIDKNLAYESSGTVYYRTAGFPDYGKLSGQEIDDLDAGARVDVDDEKQSPADFVLWKAAKPSEPSWDSPWGEGRPGWHIECSAMSTTYLGDTIDIHSGGHDLIFPHHENEIAQSEGASGQPFVHYWMHNGFLNIDNEKMSKSKGNFFTVRDILKEFEPEDVRMFMLSAQYRSPLNFSRESIEQAHASRVRLYTARDNLLFYLKSATDGVFSQADIDFAAEVDLGKQRFEAGMDDDLNTAEAIGALFDIVYASNTMVSADTAAAAITHALDTLKTLTDIFGLLVTQPDELPQDIKDMAERRTEARKTRDWKLSDEIRNELIALGYTVEDTPNGQKVSKAI